MYTIYTVLSAVAFYYMRIASQHFGVSEQFEKVLETGKHQNGLPLRTEYTGISSVDQFLSFLVVAFTPAAASFDPGSYLQVIHFLVSFFPMVSIWAVESCRKRNEWAVISFTYVWPFFYQTIGGAIIIPLYYLFYTYTSSRPNYFAPSTRGLDISRARTLLASLLLGYLLPTILAFIPWPLPDDKQLFVAVWQPSPLFINALHLIFTSMDSFSHPVAPTPKSDSRGKTMPSDMPFLNWIYGTSFVVSAIVHAGIMAICLTTTDERISLYRVFVPDQARGYTGLTEALLFIFQVDWWIIFLAGALSCVQAIWDLKVMGRSEMGVLTGLALVTVGCVVFGPGAVMSAVWWWREGVMVEMEQQQGRERRNEKKSN